MALGTDQRRQAGLKADINVTPLVDVVLVLLIIFMVVAPLLTRGQTLELPAAVATDSLERARAADDVVITLSADGRLWLGARAIDPSALARALPRRSSAAARVVIRADSSIRMRELRPVLQELKRAGAHDISLAVAGKHSGLR